MDGPGHQLFAGARGSHQQHVRIVPRHLPRKIKNFQHHRALAHDAVKLQISQQLFFQRTHPPPLVVQRGHIVQRALQSQAVQRLWQKIRGPAPYRFESRFEGIFLGDDDHVNPGIHPQQAVQKFVSMYSRQVNIREDYPTSSRLH